MARRRRLEPARVQPPLPTRVPLIFSGGAEDVVQQRDHARNATIRERVIDGPGLAPRFYERVLPQSREMLGERRLTEPDGVLQLCDAGFAFEQFAEDHQPVSVCERLEKLLGLLRLGNQRLQCRARQIGRRRRPARMAGLLGEWLTDFRWQ